MTLHEDAREAIRRDKGGPHAQMYQRLLDEIERTRAELSAVLGDWNALVAASGSKTNGAAIGHVAEMRAEIERLRKDAARERNDKDSVVLELGALIQDHAALLRSCAQWQSPDYMRLHAGEMTQQEVRTVQAVLKAIDKAMRDE